MKLDHDTLESLRRSHPSLRLLRSENLSLIVGFLHNAFIAPNKRSIPQDKLVELLEDLLLDIREKLDSDIYPRLPLDYLNDWAGSDKGWLRKFYLQGSDEPHFDLTPATEKVLHWLGTFENRSFVGTESRVLTLFEILRQISEGTESDPEKRIAELLRRREAINDEIENIRKGDIPLLDDTAVKDRFQQFVQLARELLADFRQVEQNFRQLDRQVREKITLWEGSKGALLEDIMGNREAIEDSDQGKNFRSFWSFLMSQQRQDELTQLLDRVLHLPPIDSIRPDARLRRVHYDWFEAGEHTQRTVAQLSQQLRRFLDDRAWLENKRIMDLLHNVETSALAVRKNPPKGSFMSISGTAPGIELPMERPLFSRPNKPVISEEEVEIGTDPLDLTALFAQVVVDKNKLADRVRRALHLGSEITLPDLLSTYPLEEGLAELVTYLQLASASFYTEISENTYDLVKWRGRDGVSRRGRVPRITFVRQQG